MRGLRNFIVLVCELVIFAVLLIFAIENRRPAHYTFIGNAFSGNVWWTVAGAALLGFLFALLALGPGALAARWRSRTLFRERMRREQELAELQGEHERLQTEHANTLNERDRLQRSLTAMTETNAAPAEPAMAARYAPTDFRSDGALRRGGRTDSAVQTPAPANATDREDVSDSISEDEMNDPAEGEDTGWRGRLRRLREGSGPAPEGMEPTDNPPPPTA